MIDDLARRIRANRANANQSRRRRVQTRDGGRLVRRKHGHVEVHQVGGAKLVTDQSAGKLDGVDLESQAGSGNVWKRADGAFETRRATEAGRRVAREVNLLSGK